MNLLLLPPEIQEAILFPPRTDGHGASIRERQARPIAAVLDCVMALLVLTSV